MLMFRALTIPLLALRRFIQTLPITTRRTGRGRSVIIPVAPTIRPSATLRWFSIPPPAVGLLSCLLNEFLKEHQKVAAQDSKSQQQDATISQLKSLAAEQQKEIKTLTAGLKAQADQIQKVSAQLAVDRPSPRLVSLGQ